VATAVESATTIEAAAAPIQAAAAPIQAAAAPKRLSPWEAWHLLSLDAPSVAALWACFFARTMRVSLPWHAPLMLALGTWLIYVADRLLDGFLLKPEAQLRLRHLFHARHRLSFLCAAAISSGTLVWLIVAKMSPIARREDTLLFLLSLLYLFCVHKPNGASRSWLPKELAVGIVFAAATAVPTWSRIPSDRLALMPAVALFAALCWLNCIAIERWENDLAPDGLAKANATTRWTANHLTQMAITLVVVSGWMGGISGMHSSPVMSSYAATMLSCLLFVGVDRAKASFSAISLRILADLALLTPVLFLPFMPR